MYNMIIAAIALTVAVSASGCKGATQEVSDIADESSVVSIEESSVPEVSKAFTVKDSEFFKTVAKYNQAGTDYYCKISNTSGVLCIVKHGDDFYYSIKAEKTGQASGKTEDFVSATIYKDGHSYIIDESGKQYYEVSTQQTAVLDFVAALNTKLSHYTKCTDHTDKYDVFESAEAWDFVHVDSADTTFKYYVYKTADGFKVEHKQNEDAKHEDVMNIELRDFDESKDLKYFDISKYKKVEVKTTSTRSDA